MWSLILESLQNINVAKLVQGNLFDTLISAFLRSSENIRQSIYPQMLGMSELIAKDKTQMKQAGHMLSNFVFETLHHTRRMTEGKADAVHSTGYSICQGWLDIMICGQAGRKLELSKNVHVHMTAEEASNFLEKSAEFLLLTSNKGCFEGSSGANRMCVMNLRIAQDLLQVALNVTMSDDSGNISIIEAMKRLNAGKASERFSRSLDLLLTWLFLNARTAHDITMTSGIGNTGSQTPATRCVYQLTETIEQFLTGISAMGNEKAICLALGSLLRVVRQVSAKIASGVQEGSLAVDYVLALNARMNSYFSRFVNDWLKSDRVANHFAFDLGGFEFLLDIIGKSKKSQKKTEVKQEEVSEVGKFLQDLDISDLCEILPLESKGTSSSEKKEKDEEDEAEGEKLGDDAPPLNLIELGNKNMVLQHDSANAKVVQTYNKTDWSCHKRASRTRLLVTSLVGQQLSQYQMLFKLSKTALVREI